MFLNDFWPGSQSNKQRTNQPLPQPMTLITRAQAHQVAGGCSNPKGCITRDKGGSTVPLRQPAITDFMDRRGGCPMPFVLPQ